VIEKFKRWMWWRGIEPRDLFAGGFCLAFLISTTILFIAAIIAL